MVGELHALSSISKAKGCEQGCRAIIESRSILGGHGYSNFSNLAGMYHDLDPTNSGEGDNNLIIQQTSKFLIKTISNKLATNIINLEFIYEKD